MRTETIVVYKFNELSDNAKHKAREWYKQGIDYPWFDESMNSIRAFCDHFDVTIKDWAIGAFSPSWVRTDAETLISVVKLHSMPLSLKLLRMRNSTIRMKPWTMP